MDLSIKYVKPKYIEKNFGINTRTLFNYGTNEKVKFITENGRRHYDLDSVIEYINSTCVEKEEEDLRENICYVRIPLNGDTNFLTEQTNYFKDNFPKRRIISDTCDKFKDSNLFKLIEEIKSNKISKINLYYNNIIRYDVFNFISILCDEFNVKIISNKNL